MNGHIRHRTGSLAYKYGKLRRDPRGVLLDKMRPIAEQISLAQGNIVSRLAALIWGIDLSPDCRFYGSTHFMRHPFSIIRIEGRATFRSSFRSNLIGLNRPCCLSTHAEGAEITIGSRCGFSGTVIAARQRIALGEHVLCGANSTITDFDWHAVDPSDRDRGVNTRSAAVTIGANVWLGLNCVVLKGVCIGDNSVIGANSVVTSDIPPGVIAAGSPARVVRVIPNIIDHYDGTQRSHIG